MYKFKVSDKIRILYDEPNHTNYLTGDILIIGGIGQHDRNGDLFIKGDTNNDDVYMHSNDIDDQFELVEEDFIFQVGDSVLCISKDSDYESNYVKVGNVYIVSIVKSDNQFIILEGCPYLYRSKDFELKAIKTPFIFQVGDIIEFGGTEYELYKNGLNLRLGRSYIIVYPDGKYLENDIKPIIKFIRRSDKDVTITIKESKAKELGLL